MFHLLRDLGEHISKEGTSPVDQIAEPLGAAYHYGVAVCFDEAGSYRGVTLKQGYSGVIYKSGPSNGFDFTLVSRHSGNLGSVPGALHVSLGVSP